MRPPGISGSALDDRIRTMSIKLLRRTIALLALLTVTVTAGVSHQHGAGELTEAVFGERLVIVDSCGERVPHFHAAKLSEQDACVACARQHLQGLAQASILAMPARRRVRPDRSPAAFTARPIVRSQSSRGPPSLS